MNNDFIDSTSSVDSPSLAGRGARLVGQMIDTLIPLLVIAVISIVMEVTGKMKALTLSALIFWPIYVLLADGLNNGQSVGKRVVKTRVVDSETGKPCTFWQSFLRNIFYIVGIIDWIFIFGENRQRLGDKVAGTIVVEA